MLPAMFDYVWLTANPWTWTIPAAGLFLGIWVWVDASDKTDYPALWGIMVMICWPVFFPLYYLLLFVWHQRPRTQHVAEELEMRRMPKVLGKTAMEREYMLAQLQEGPGTVYDPQSGMSRKTGGYRYRPLELVDDLQVRDPEAAWDYLVELHETAEQEQDSETVSTCEWYMRRLPDGNARYPHWLKHRHDPPPQTD
ncbi:hypothetical protein KDL44_06960 [bacterium]|nr:hypothetical protein [bacterium]